MKGRTDCNRARHPGSAAKSDLAIDATAERDSKGEGENE